MSTPGKNMSETKPRLCCDCCCDCEPDTEHVGPCGHPLCQGCYDFEMSGFGRGCSADFDEPPYGVPMNRAAQEPSK